jgi:ABC-2 type transport system permease protein
LLQFLSFLNPRIIADPHHYRIPVWTICYNFFLLIELYLSMVVILLVGPNLISQDLRYNALPLYFSRPLRRIDYFLGKLGVIVIFLGRMIVLPCLIAYILGLLFSLDISILRETLPLLFSSLAYGLIISVSAGLLVLALSSLSRNSRYVALFWLGIWFVSSAVAAILEQADHDQRTQVMYSRMPAYDPTPGSPAQQAKQEHAREQAAQKAYADFDAAEFRAAKTNWRPVLSYTGNLRRIGEHLLGSNASWETIGQLEPPDERDRFLFKVMGSQFPWKWSAAVLLALFGFSAWILNFRIKSLDRLK